MDWKSVADSLAGAAKVVSAWIPQAAAVPAAIEIGKKLADVIDDFTDKVPEARDSAELAIAQKELRDRTSSKAQSTADRLEG